VRFRNEVSEDDGGINLTPLIDVVFLLLIFFMVSTTFDTTSELKIELPQASAQKRPSQQDKLTIMIDPQGFYYINGKRLKNQRSETLLLELHRVVGKNKDLPVVVQSDAKSPVQSMVTALDIVGQIGMTHLSIATTKPLN
jgi:biopolymer transport protein ExbD